jgi:primosomal protein N' (replication factor Y)
MALLVRAARRLGPRANGGRLLVQTRLPDHEVLEAVRRADPTLVAAAERPRRELLGYPPFGALAEVRGAGEAVTELLRGMRAHPEITVLGPSAVPTGLEALLHAGSPDALAAALAASAPAARAAGRIRIAVDPPRV